MSEKHLASSSTSSGHLDGGAVVLASDLAVSFARRMGPHVTEGQSHALLPSPQAAFHATFPRGFRPEENRCRVLADPFFTLILEPSTKKRRADAKRCIVVW